MIYIDTVVTSSNCILGVRIRKEMDWKLEDIGVQEYTESYTRSRIKRTSVLGTVVRGKSFDLYKNDQSKYSNFIIFINIVFNPKIKLCKYM